MKTNIYGLDPLRAQLEQSIRRYNQQRPIDVDCLQLAGEEGEVVPVGVLPPSRPPSPQPQPLSEHDAELALAKTEDDEEAAGAESENKRPRDASPPPPRSPYY